MSDYDVDFRLQNLEARVKWLVGKTVLILEKLDLEDKGQK